MNILLICISGITTNVLANKLQAYGNKNGYHDTFIATKMDSHEDLLQLADVVFVAPQAQFYLAAIEARAQSLHIPVLNLKEENLVFGQVEAIYEILSMYRKSEQTGTFVQVQRRLHQGDYVSIMKAVCLRCFPILILGGLSYLLSYISALQNFYLLYQVMVPLFGMYVMFSVGYCYGIHIHKEPLAFAFLTMSAPLLLLPMDNVFDYWTPFIRIKEGYLPLSMFGLHNCLFLLFCSLLTVFLLDHLQNLKLHPKTQSSYSQSLTQHVIEMPLKYGIVFLVFLFLRFLLTCFLSH